ncbi:unnamed protein product [Mytilus edulis]|uniref:Uncharacterized protein n=1 Tax=Mytilus edulis TaxID=6550 RepID=A0A8S3QYH9_MYTED|nr:unnamed protein product [Mytilus edulis]
MEEDGQPLGPAPKQIDPGNVEGETISSVLLPEPCFDIKQKIQDAVDEIATEENTNISINKKGQVSIPWPTRETTGNEIDLNTTTKCSKLYKIIHTLLEIILIKELKAISKRLWDLYLGLIVIGIGKNFQSQESGPENPSVNEIIAVEKYVSGYACKGNEPTGAVADLFNDMVNSADETTGSNTKSLCTKLLMGTVKRDISAVETSFELSALPLYRSSHAFQNISLTGARILEKMDPLLQKLTPLDKYLSCPENDHCSWHFLLTDYCPNFVKADVERANNAAQNGLVDDESDDDNSEFENMSQPEWIKVIKPNAEFTDNSEFKFDDGDQIITGPSQTIIILQTWE